MEKRKKGLGLFLCFVLVAFLSWGQAGPALGEEAKTDPAATEVPAADKQADKAGKAAAPPQPEAQAQEGASSLDKQLKGIKVSSIEVEGNKQVARGQILQAVKEVKLGEEVTEAKVKADLQNIADLGLFMDVSAKFSEYKGGVRVTFVVQENPVVKGIEISGGGLPPEIKEKMQVKVGKVLNTKLLQEDIKKILDTAMEEYGLALRLVNVGFDEGGILNLKFNETRLGQIKITGNTKTREYVIRRELDLRPGEPLNMKKLRTELWKVLNLGFFDEVVPKFEPTKDPDVTDLVIEVKERKTGTAAAGGGYSSAEGLVGYIEIAEQNLLGRGQALNLRWQFSKSTNLYELGFTEPYLDRHKTSLSLDLYNKNLREGNTTMEGTGVMRGAELTLGRPVTLYTRVYLGYRNYNYYPDEQQTAEESEAHIRSLTFSTYNNTADHPYYPTRGWRNRLALEVGGHYLRGTHDFYKLEEESSRYFKVGPVHTLALRINGGYATGNLPESEIYRVGGSETVRGYNEFQFKGNKKLVANAEYRVKMADNLQAVLFYDVGNAWTQEEPVSLANLHSGAGIGLRVETPIGPIRIDYGINLAEKKGQTYFSIGQSF